MKIVRFLGGLGNQMFQYTFYKALEKRFPNVRSDLNGYKNYPLHNGFELEHIFNIKLDKVSPFISNLHNIHNRKWVFRCLRHLLRRKKTYEEERYHFAFDPAVFSSAESKYYWGYWQNQEYFKNIREEIKKDFSFKLPLNQHNQQILKQINETNSIGVHIRRGDYIKDPLLGGLCGLEYYQKAIQVIQSKTILPVFFIFSDDPDWCIENLVLKNSKFISWNKGQDSYIDMQLMSACKHNIIANSSFSWWAAWLNQNPEKVVIGPEKWVNDAQIDTTTLLPLEWIKL